MYLDYAEDQAKQRRTITMAQWSDKLDAFLKFNERDLLTHAGKVTAAVAEKLATKRYREFATQRRKQAAIENDEADIRELEAFAKQSNKEDENG